VAVALTFAPVPVIRFERLSRGYEIGNALTSVLSLRGEEDATRPSEGKQFEFFSFQKRSQSA